MASDAPGLRRWAAHLGLLPDDLPARELDRPLARLDGAWVAQQGSSPRGTYKERGAEPLAALIARRGLSEVFLDSSGNAGLAVAAACGARGIACRVLVPAATPADKLERLAAAGARVEVVPGDRQATYEAAQALRGRLPYASHIFQPAFHAGLATLAWDLDRELTAARAGGASAGAEAGLERIVLPAGNGSLLLGLRAGCERLVAAGRLPRLPALHAVQLAGYASLAPEPGLRAPGPPVAAGVAVADPPRQEEMARAISASGGDVTVVGEEEIAAAREELAVRGFATDPTGAAAWAGLARRPDLPRTGTVVVLTSREGG